MSIGTKTCIQRTRYVYNMTLDLALPEEYGEFDHKAGIRFTKFSDIRKEIIAQTRVLTKSEKDICVDSIRLTVYSPSGLNHVIFLLSIAIDLTLIDLPGMVQIAINQDEKIVEDIKKMIIGFIEKDSCLILAVSAANTDLANSGALQLAKECDPVGKRTIGVLTKLDLMDEGTNASEILKNNVLPLHYGK